jgi:hypothetical protein
MKGAIGCAAVIVSAVLALTPTATAQPEPDAAARGLRNRFLSRSMSVWAEMGVARAPEYPSVFGVAMDWPLGDKTATIVAATTGDASVYISTGGGLIGGGGHAAVRDRARHAVTLAQSPFKDATPVTAFPFPPPTHVRFYLRGYDGVRMVDGPRSALENGQGPLAALFAAMQDVLTALRKASPAP